MKHRCMLLTISLLLCAACEVGVLPSRGLEVSLEAADATRPAVVDAIDHFLLAQGFEPRGKNGYEEINNVKLSQSYDHPSGIYCAVNLRDGPAVRLRVGVNADDWSSEADRIFEELSTALEARWPGSVRKEPMPDGQ